MKRLIDSEASDPATRQAQEVLKRVRPLGESEARLRRVRHAIDRSPVRGKVSRRFPHISFPHVRHPRALGVVILVGVGISAAAAGSAWWVDRGEPSPAPSGAAPAKPSSSASTSTPSPATGASTKAESPPAPTPSAVRPPPSLQEAVPQKAAPQETSTPAPTAAARRQPTEVERLHAAATALRRDGDPGRALRLLDGMGTKGSGALDEEALALRVEAAARAGDPSASRLAKTYLTHYPTGRYAERVRESLRAPSSP